MKAQIKRGILFALLLTLILPSFAYAAEGDAPEKAPAVVILIALLFIAVVKRIELRIDPKERKEADILKGIER